MSLNDNGKNALCDGLATVAIFASLHTGDPSTTGANEATGGSPAYARKSVTYAAASTGTRASNIAQTFDVPAATYFHVGLWSASTAGTFYGYLPLGGYTPQTGNVVASTDVITSFAHGLIDTNRVMVFDIQNVGMPTGLTEGTAYFVVTAATDTFQLSLTSGGAAVNVTADGELGFQRVLPDVFAGQGQLQLNSGSLTIDARFV